jgi:hypothetical protein
MYTLPVFFFFAVLAFELRAYLEPLHRPLFVMGFFEIGSCEVFAWADFEPILLISAS